MSAKPVIAPQTLFAKAENKSLLSKIKRLTSLPSQNYDQMYMEVIARFACYVQELPHPTCRKFQYSGGFFEGGLLSGLSALKLRQSAVFPLNADPGVVREKSELYSYACFVGALLYDIGELISNIEVYTTEGRWSPCHGPLYQPLPGKILRFKPLLRYENYQARLVSTSHKIPSCSMFSIIMNHHGLTWLSTEPCLYALMMSTDDNHPVRKLLLNAVTYSKGSELKPSVSIGPEAPEVAVDPPPLEGDDALDCDPFFPQGEELINEAEPSASIGTEAPEVAVDPPPLEGDDVLDCDPFFPQDEMLIDDSTVIDSSPSPKKLDLAYVGENAFRGQPNSNDDGKILFLNYFIAGLKAYIDPKKSRINEKQALVHLVDGYLFLVSPSIFSDFLKRNPRFGSISADELEKLFRKCNVYTYFPTDDWKVVSREGDVVPGYLVHAADVVLGSDIQNSTFYRLESVH